MRLINLTRNRKQRLLIMLKGLIPEYNSIRIVTIRGLPIVIFKKDWWKFWTRYSVNITDLCISELPKRLDQLAQQKGFGKYRAFFNNIIFDIVAFQENPHTQYVDIVDYLWEYYNKIYNSHVTILPSSHQCILVKSSYLPIPLGKIVYSYNINQIVKNIQEYFKFEKVKQKRIVFPQDTPTSYIRHIYLSLSNKVREINIDFGLRTALG
jgi:hypothetical protein